MYIFLYYILYISIYGTTQKIDGSQKSPHLVDIFLDVPYIYMYRSRAHRTYHLCGMNMHLLGLRQNKHRSWFKQHTLASVTRPEAYVSLPGPLVRASTQDKDPSPGHVLCWFCDSFTRRRIDTASTSKPHWFSDLSNTYMFWYLKFVLAKWASVPDEAAFDHVQGTQFGTWNQSCSPPRPVDLAGMTDERERLPPWCGEGRLRRSCSLFNWRSLCHLHESQRWACDPMATG